jgi:hypothetical protein
MFRSSNQTQKSSAHGALWAAAALLVLSSAPGVEAQTYCQEWTDVLLDTTSNCVSSHLRERAFTTETFLFGGSEYMMLNRGNELGIYRISDADRLHPEHVDGFDFWPLFGTAGDSDYDLMNFDVCDDCRYGVIDHKVAGVVLFDLGTGSEPAVRDWAKYGILNQGSVTFKVGTQQYVIAVGIDGNCGNASGLWAINNIDSPTFLQCLEVDGAPFKVSGGVSFKHSTGTYLYLGGGNLGDARVFQASGTGTGLRLTHTATPAGMKGRTGQLSVDPNYNILASAVFADRVVRFWDVATNPADPTPKTDWTLPATAGSVKLASASSSSPLVMWISAAGWLNATRTFLIDPVNGPEPFDNDFWTDTSQPHNEFQRCVPDMDGSLSRDGSALYLSRYATQQVFDLSQCMGPTPAVADVTVNPSTVFPGGEVTVRDNTAGSYDRWRVWIEANSDYVAGDQTLSGTNSHNLTYTIPKAVAEGVDYVGHVEVDSSELPPTQATDSAPIGINRAPQASFTIFPEAAIIGDTVTLTATAEGFPSATSPFTWLIQKPSSATSFPTGPSVQVNLNEPGQWTFKLTVNYDHGASGATADPDGDLKYEAVVTKLLNVSSVAADFTISPATPLNNLALILDGSISKGVISTYEWTVYGPTNRGGDGIEPSAYNGCGNVTVCTVPADTLEWGSYDISLQVTAATGGETDVREKSTSVGNGSIQPVFSWSPTGPSIGDNVLFTIAGVMVDIDKATWNMGGTGCDGASATQVCTPSLYNNCKAQAFQYASSGSKVVQLSVEIDGVVYTDDRPASQRTVVVDSSGTCGGGGGTTCTYTLSSTAATFGPGGGTGSFSVFTSSSCSWTASDGAPWITITSGASGTGTGTVRYSVAANSGPQRVGYITAGGRVFSVIQNPPTVPANFTMSTSTPKIGEVMAFDVDPILEVESWDFGEEDCHGDGPTINCTWLPPGTCNNVDWAFPTAGEKSVTMKLVDGRTQTKHPTVQNKGECCQADGRPSASFSMSTDEAVVGESVVLTDTSNKSLATKVLAFVWAPTDPEIGESVTFTLNGVTGTIAKATWDFGEAGCGGANSVQVCTPGLFNDCKAMSFTFASGGAKTVSVAVELEGGGTTTVGPKTVSVQNTGSCDGGGGGGGCSYSVTPISAQFTPAGGEGSFNVSTSTACAWSVNTSASWIDLTTASGVGPGTVGYSVEPYTGTSLRTGLINVEGRTHTVRQNPPEVESNNEPTAWLWTISLKLEDGSYSVIDTSPERNLTYQFQEAGTYRVSLVASNCAGSSETWKTIEVTGAPIEDFVVGAAVSLAGANETQWETDFRFYNPCNEPLDVRIEYEPEGINNTDVQLVYRQFQLAADETRLFSDIVEAIPGLAGDELSGSVRIESSSDSGCKVLSVSRTFNSTPYGSLGLFVPALPVKRNTADFLDLTGLIHDSEYRTNLRLVSYEDDDLWVPIALFDHNGNQVGQSRSALVRGHSTKQLNAIAPWLGVDGDIAPFSVRADVTGVDVQAFATVVDNQTGDSVLYLSSFTGENRIWLVGVANLAGVNDSQWRTDLWLYNPTADWMGGEVEFVVGDTPTDVYGTEMPALGAHRVKQYLDVVGDEFGLEETRGYIVLTGADGGPAPQVAARTYNLDLAGGTYGLNLRAFGESDLLYPGDVGHVVGVSNSADQNVGFRTNLGLLNTDRDRWTGVRLTLIDVSGTPVGEPIEMMIAPGVLRQFDLAKKFGVGDVTGTASLTIEVTEGGGIAAYATEIDNRTQDSIYIPAQRKFMGVAR